MALAPPLRIYLDLASIAAKSAVSTLVL